MVEQPSPEMPPRPERPSPGSDHSSAGTWIALFGLVMIGGALLGLTALVMPQFLGLIAVVGGLFVVPITFHYLVWGWRIAQMRDEDPDDD